MRSTCSERVPGGALAVLTPGIRRQACVRLDNLRETIGWLAETSSTGERRIQDGLVAQGKPGAQ